MSHTYRAEPSSTKLAAKKAKQQRKLAFQRRKERRNSRVLQEA